MVDALSEAVAAGRRMTGTVLTLPTVTVAELLAEPFDFVWIDLEHGALGPLDAQELIIGAQAVGTYALVRLPAHAHDQITPMADAGADGIVLADVRDPAAVTAAAARLEHPPAGIRGWGPRRSGLHRRTTGTSHSRPSLWIQIESAQGVERAEAIAATPGLDAMVVGTADLSFAVGRPHDLDAPELLDAVAAVRDACRVAGPAFALAGALDRLPATILDGASLLVHSTDARLCARAVDDAASWLRGALGVRA